MKLNIVEEYLIKFFKWLSYHVGQRPWTFFIAPLVIGFTVILLALTKIVVENRFNRETDINFLYSSVNGFASEDKISIDEIFPLNTTDNFNFMAITDFPKLKVTLLIVQPKDGGNILRSSILEEIMQLNNQIETINITWNGEQWRFKDMCSRNLGKCVRNSANHIYKNIHQIETGDYKLPYPYELNSHRKLNFYSFDLGGIDLDTDGTIKSAKTMFQYFFLDGMSYDKIERARLWKAKVSEFLNGLKMENITVDYCDDQSIERECAHNIITTFPYLVGGGVVILIACMLAVNLDNVVRNKPWLAFIGCINALNSMLIGFAICILCEVTYIDLNIFIAFLVLGIGMDDTFMLISAWKQSSNLLTAEERVSESFTHVGLSITLTTLTNVISFIIGTLSSVPAIHYFCIYMSVTIVCNYIYQIISFGGAMVIFGNVEKQNRHSFFFWKTVVPVTNKKPCSPKVPMLVTLNQRVINYLQMTLKMYLKNKKLEDIYLNVRFQITVVLLFIGYISIGIYGTATIEETLDLKRLVRTDSYFYGFLEKYQKYHTDFKICNQIVVNKTIDFSNPQEASEIEGLIAKFQLLPQSGNSSQLWSWLEYYKLFISHSATKSLLTGLNMTMKEDFMIVLKNVFLKSSLGKIFAGDIKFNDNGTDIIASRYLLPVAQLKDVSDKKEFFSQLTYLKKTLPKNVYVYSYMYKLLEAEVSLKSDVFRSLSYCCLVLMMIVIIFMPNITSIVWVTLSILSIQIGIIGFMGAFGLKLDHTVMLALIMCVGLSIDFTSHFAYALSSSKEYYLKERVMAALKSTGLPIIQSCISTLIGISAVFFLPSITFLKAVFAITLLLIFSLLHSLVLLPTLLLIKSYRTDIENIAQRVYVSTDSIFTISGLKEIPKKKVIMVNKNIKNEI